MDWTNKHFDRETVFHEPRDLVFDAARSFAADSLVGWQIAETADGFEAKGSMASHAATAKFRIKSVSDGTQVTVTLLVARAGALGFMVFDIGGYYDGQLRRWLEGIQWKLHWRLTSATEPPAMETGKQAIPKTTRTGNLFGGCLMAAILLIPLIYFICAVIGLLTGHLYLPSRGSGGGTIDGAWARIISVIILVGLAWIFRWLRKRS